MLGWLSLALCGWLALAANTTNGTIPDNVPLNAFGLPYLPISKANAVYPDCRAEIIFVLDVSASVAISNQQTMMRFVAQFMIGVEMNVMAARYGVVIFGIRGSGTNSEHYDATPFGGSYYSFNPPIGNGQGSSTTVLLGLDFLKYDCVECAKVNSSWSQLEMMQTVGFAGNLTPTWDGLTMGKDEYESHGDPTVPGRFIVLVTDGIPNIDQCYVIGTPACDLSVLLADEAVNATKNGTLLITVGMNLDSNTQPLMIAWASDPKDILAIPSTDYSQLKLLIPKLLPYICPAGTGVNCLPDGADHIDVSGVGFLNTGHLMCRYFRDGESPTPSRTTVGQYINATLIRCPIPTQDWFTGTWNLEYTRDGRGYYKGPRFKFGTLCKSQLLIIWWPFLALALLPLAFCRPAKTAPVTTTKVTRGVARPAPAATEEYEEYEEVEEIVAPPEPVNKWKVAPTAYIGFGRARMSVDWAGVAPESAPHEGVRKKVVKKVVSDHAPVPTAGPASTPTPAAPAQETTTTTTTSRPPIVEEPDWVNSFMDKIAAVICCCCVNKK
jgi:hypothetical protein